MSRKATILMRVLAVTSAFEAAGGLALLIPTFIKLRSPQGEGVLYDAMHAGFTALGYVTNENPR